MNLSPLRSPVTVGVFSPSSPVSSTAPTRYDRGKRFLQAHGLRVKDGALYGRRDGYRSGSAEARAEEFNALLRDESVDVLMASVGGFNTNSILPYIDYAYFRAHPKPVVGYSDATALLLALYAKTGVPTFYGPALAASFGELPPFAEMTFSCFDSVVLHPAPVPFPFPLPPFWTDERLDWETQTRPKQQYPNRPVCVIPGKCRGRLIGGNLNTLEGIFGTPYMPEIREGDVLFLEDSMKSAMIVERSFTLLKLAGVFDRVGGILLGKHELYDDCGTGRKPWEVLTEVLGSGFDKPVSAEFDCCHTHPMLTLPIGCEVVLDADANTLALSGSPFGEPPAASR